MDFQGIRGLSFDDPAGYPTAGCILFRLDLRSLRASEGPITIVSVQEGLNLAKRASGGGEESEALHAGGPLGGRRGERVCRLGRCGLRGGQKNRARMPQNVRSRGGEGNRIGCFSKKFFCLDFDDPGEGGDNDHAVVGFALRFALNARPTGSQGFAPGKPTTKTRTNAKSKKKSKTKNNNGTNTKGDISKEL